MFALNATELVALAVAASLVVLVLHRLVRDRHPMRPEQPERATGGEPRR
ncbi:MAG: hypothetical protein ACRCZD_11705 [Phycicoccus sp.]